MLASLVLFPSKYLSNVGNRFNVISSHNGELMYHQWVHSSISCACFESCYTLSFVVSVSIRWLIVIHCHPSSLGSPRKGRTPVRAASPSLSRSRSSSSRSSPLSRGVGGGGGSASGSPLTTPRRSSRAILTPSPAHSRSRSFDSRFVTLYRDRNAHLHVVVICLFQFFFPSLYAWTLICI